MEGFITVEGTGARAATYGPLHTGLFNSTSWQPPGTPAAPEAIPWSQLVTGDLRRFAAAGHPLLTLLTINRFGHGGTTPPNEPPDGPLDIPAREDALFTTDFADLHQLALGAPLGQAAELGPDGRPLRDGQAQPVTSVAAWEHGVLAVNWISQPSPATFGDLSQILADTLPPGSGFRLPGQLYDLFGRQFIDLTDGPASPGRSGLAPVPGPDLSNADMFGPPPGFSPVLPGGDFLYNFASADVFGTQIMTGPGGTMPFPWTG